MFLGAAEVGRIVVGRTDRTHFLRSRTVDLNAFRRRGVLRIQTRGKNRSDTGNHQGLAGTHQDLLSLRRENIRLTRTRVALSDRLLAETDVPSRDDGRIAHPYRDSVIGLV